MEAVRYGLCILLLIQRNHGGLVSSNSGCNWHNLSGPSNVASSAVESYPFRTDLLTVEECNRYVKLALKKKICALTTGLYDLCEITDENPRRSEMLNTYVYIGCTFEPRTVTAETIKRVSQISPQRAVFVSLFERPDEEDTVSADLVQPVRDQIIDLGVFNCHSPNATAKVYELGTLPNLFSFALNDCQNLTIRRTDFGRMPQLRMIAFYVTTISTLEPGTFTDLVHLRSLVLERDYIKALLNKENTAHVYSSYATDDYLDYLHNLHCNCSFAWLRNFLEQNPFLIEEKDPGEVFIIGNYLSEGVERNGNGTAVFSVDCSRDVTLKNIWTGNKFSYNASCITVTC